MSQLDSVPVRTSTNIQTAIGRRLYPDAHIAIVELVSNAYDADADNVNVLVTPSKIIVIDDGWGMTQESLGNFFTIGKSTKGPSQKGREPIGAFGIGKFAILSMADSFVVFTKSANFRAKASYSHQDAMASGQYLNDYQVPVEIYDSEEEYHSALADEVGTDDYYNSDNTGVTIVMHNLHRQYSDQTIKQRLSEMLVPQAKGEFKVFVNGEGLEERYIHGLRYDINVNTTYGDITGEVIVAAESIELGPQAGIQVQVQSRGLYRTYFGLYDYDRSAKRLSGYVVANWLNGVIASNRTELINSPEKTAFEEAMTNAVRSILDQEALKRGVEDEEKKKQVLDRAVRTVTRVLSQMPELDFPKRPLDSMIPIGALDDLLAGKDPAADIQPQGQMMATITATRGTRAFAELLDYLRQIAPQYNVDPSTLPTDIRTVSEALNVIEQVLGVSLQDLVTPETLQQLLGTIPETVLQDQQQIEGVLRLAAQRLKDLVQRVATQTLQDIPTENAQLASGVTLRTPITNSLELGNVNLSPVAPPLDTATLDLSINPTEEGYVPNAPQAQINNFIAASVEHLGEDGPASMVAEGFSFDGIQIYINADHAVFQSIKNDSPNMLAFYQAQLIFGEVILMQNFTPRESMEKQGELMRLLLQVDKKILKQ